MSNTTQTREELKHKLKTLTRQDYVAYYSAMPLDKLIDHHEALSEFTAIPNNDTAEERNHFNSMIVQIDLEILKRVNKQDYFYYLLESNTDLPFVSQEGFAYLYSSNQNANIAAMCLQKYNYNVVVQKIDFKYINREVYFYELLSVQGAKGIILEETGHRRGIIIDASYIQPKQPEKYLGKERLLNPELNLTNTMYNQYSPMASDRYLAISEQNKNYYTLKLRLYKELAKANLIMPLSMRMPQQYNSLNDLAEIMKKQNIKEIPLSTVRFNDNKYIILYSDWFHHEQFMRNTPACTLTLQNLVQIVGKENLFNSYKGIIINPGYSHGITISKRLYELVEEAGVLNDKENC